MPRRVSVGFNWQGELDREAAFEGVKVAEAAGAERDLVRVASNS